MIKTRFDYKPLSRESVDGQRLYSLPDGSKVPSVTTILDQTKPDADAAALDAWRKAVGEQKAKQVSEEASSRGTRMHNYLEHYVLNGFHKPAPRNPFALPSHRMAQSIIDSGLCHMDEVWGVEVALYYSGLYAGTSDGIGVWKGIPCIFDYKQTNKPKTEERVEGYKIQLAAYAEAHNHMFGTDISHGIVMMCVKPDDKNPTEIPQYQEFVVEKDEFKHWANEWWNRVHTYYASNINT